MTKKANLHNLIERRLGKTISNQDVGDILDLLLLFLEIEMSKE